MLHIQLLKFLFMSLRYSLPFKQAQLLRGCLLGLAAPCDAANLKSHIHPSKLTRTTKRR